MSEKFREELIQEIDQLQNRIHKLEKMDQTYDHFNKLSMDLLCVAGFDGYFKHLSPSWEKTLGFTIAELSSKPFIEFVHPEDQEMTAKEAEKLKRANGRVMHFENRYLCKDGSYKWLLWNAVTSLGEEVYYCVTRDITDRKEKVKEIERLSLTDELTGLFNRRGFLHHAESYFKFAIRKKMGLLYFLVDVDGLKKINDSYGHKEGDWTLIKAAEIFRSTFRDSDIIARIGGDEFAILAIEAWKNSADVLLTRLHERLGLYNSGDEPPYEISFSIGFAHYDPENPSNVETLMSKADTMLYQQKKSKSRV